jgi:hypothetical protein
MEQMNDELSTIVALLHDVIEDTHYSFEDLKHMGFGNDEIEALRLLTHDTEVPYLDYVKKIAANPTARKVKLADLAHNSDITRLDHEPTERDLKRLEKYREARRILLETSPGSSNKIDISFDFRNDTLEKKDPDNEIPWVTEVQARNKSYTQE